MRPRHLRFAAWILTSISLVNGLLLGVVHHHRGHLSPPSATCPPVHQHANAGCGGHHPVQHRPQPGGDPADQPEDCRVCQYLAQQPTVQEFSEGVQPLAAREWTSCDSFLRPQAVRWAAYQNRGPPT